MQFLKTIFWVVIAVFLAIVSRENWHDVTINLWGDLQADVKLPVLVLLIAFLAFLPTYLLLRGQIWSLRRRLAYFDRPLVEPAEPKPVQSFEQEAEARP